MRLILIRHGDPDYEHDDLTEKGKREATLLAERASHWKVDDVYVSPLGRARATAKPCLARWDKQASVLDWAQEFFYLVDDGKGGKRIPWDYYPSEWTGEEKYFLENHWVETDTMRPVAEEYAKVCNGLDGLLSRYGYERNGRAYRVRERSEKTVVFFCHFAVSMIFLSHLLNMPALALLHGVYLAPTSVTVLNTEERFCDQAYFRAERIGDACHLITGNEPISESGYFTTVMQELS